ncbi:MAG: AAA family ATPase [Candidatus Aminicenantes bacterium]|nr:AAA family ATPase [Candidatus Aminicenantes bacterium]
MKKEVRLIGLTGTNSAGKGEAAAYFKKKGYTYFSLSDLIREELIKKGKDVTRNNLIQMGNQLREKSGPEILARLILKKIRGRAVIDSIRNPKEIDYLKKQKNFILLAIDAPVELRYKRAKKRGREESVSTLQEFIEKEAEEKTNRKKGQQLLNCIKMADFVVINDGSLKNLHKKLEKLI